MRDLRVLLLRVMQDLVEERVGFHSVPDGDLLGRGTSTGNNPPAVVDLRQSLPETAARVHDGHQRAAFHSAVRYEDLREL
mgnify:CR=1 FL=1